MFGGSFLLYCFVGNVPLLVEISLQRFVGRFVSQFFGRAFSYFSLAKISPGRVFGRVFS